MRAFRDALDYQNRFYYVGIIIRRWMALRIQAIGSLMILAVSIFGLLTTKVSPAIFGVVLTYTLQSTASFSKMILKHAAVEQRECLSQTGVISVVSRPLLERTEMNAWERVSISRKVMFASDCR